jgi:hypothetical protein
VEERVLVVKHHNLNKILIGRFSHGAQGFGGNLQYRTFYFDKVA